MVKAFLGDGYQQTAGHRTAFVATEKENDTKRIDGEAFTFIEQQLDIILLADAFIFREILLDGHRR
jgi:hypothetical protein